MHNSVLHFEALSKQSLTFSLSLTFTFSSFLLDEPNGRTEISYAD